MTVWDWIGNFRCEAMARGDRERLRLTEFHPRAYTLRETDPDRAIAIYLEGRHLAYLLQEPLWVLFFDHWHVTMLLWFKQDYAHVLDLAVRNVLEARKPMYEPLRLRLTIQRTLLCVYQALDLHGYADEIREGLDDLASQISLEGEEKYLIQSNHIGFYYTIGDHEAARDACLVTLRWADQDGDQYDATHHAVYAHALLCGACWHLRDWEGMDNWAAIGAEVTRRSGHRMEAAEFRLWQAVVARHEGDEPRAARLRRQGLTQLKYLRAPTSDLCFEALCAYHVIAGEWDRVVKVRRRELARCEKQGSLDEIVRCRVRICRALGEQGRPTHDEVEIARELAHGLRRPQVYLEELDAIVHRSAEGS